MTTHMRTPPHKSLCPSQMLIPSTSGVLYPTHWTKDIRAPDSFDGYAALFLDMDSHSKEFIELQNRFTKEFFENPISQSIMANKDFIHRFVKKYPNKHVLASPLFEVLSIRISNHTASDKAPYQVYGTIEVSDGQGDMFTIYDRSGDIPDIVCNGDALRFALPKGRTPITITPSNVVTLRIALRARIEDHDEEIINECHTWYYKTVDDFDKVKTDKINGVRGLAVVDYVSYRHAVFAYVHIKLLKEKHDETCDSARVYGRVVANCGNRYSTVLFDKKRDDSMVVKYGKRIEISTRLVVPAWSSFTIYADLWNADTNRKFVDETDKQCHDIPVKHDLPYDIELGGQNEYMLVNVMWGHADLELANLQRKVIADQQTLTSLEWRMLSCFSESSALEVWEVFSISVYSNNSDEELNLWGSIDVYEITNQESYFTFFERTFPQRLLPNQTIPIQYPTSCIKSPSFLTLNLIGNDGRVISKGDIYWDEYNFGQCTSCLNRLLCSVVRGDDGYYATVHYTLFPDALQATVKICLIDKTSSLKETKVNGCIRAQYKEFTYATPWEKESYRRRLFVGRDEDPLLQFSDSKIQLSECAISVGLVFTLVIDLDLVVISDPDEFEISEMEKAGECFKQQLQFSPEMGCKEILVDRTSHRIGVSVEWSEIY